MWFTKLKIIFFKKLTNLKQINASTFKPKSVKAGKAVSVNMDLANDMNIVTEHNEFFENNVQKFNSKIIEREDMLAVETPVALIYNDISHTVMMASPQDLDDFAFGFSLAEGIIDNTSDIYGIDIEQTHNGIEIHIEMATRCFTRLKERRRSMAGRTGCGICGSEQLAQVIKILPQLKHTLQFDLNRLDDCLQQLHEAQILAKQTGASHAAAFFNLQGELIMIREDVGRHVALDKLLGWYMKHQQPKGFILVTSRASYEMVQKTASCGIEMLIAISAATDLAVKMAEMSHLTLVGFAREGRATIYTGKERLVFE